MKRCTAVIVLAGFLLAAPSDRAMAGVLENAIDSMAGSIARIYGQITKQRFVLYLACAAHYLKLNKWPLTEDDLLTMEDAVTTEDKGKDVLNAMVKEMNIVFTPISDKSVLITGQYNQETEDGFRKIGMGRCRLSVVASAEKDEIVFTPSDDTKTDKDYFNIPARVKKKEGGAEGVRTTTRPYGDLTSLKSKDWEVAV